jgi:hypothetical protein
LAAVVSVSRAFLSVDSPKEARGRRRRRAIKRKRSSAQLEEI